jgi:hypothetical protein
MNYIKLLFISILSLTSQVVMPAFANPYIVEITVFWDKSGVGRYDGSGGLEGWTVNLEQPAGTVIKTAKTDYLGWANFTLERGKEYTVSVVPKSGWKLTGDGKLWNAQLSQSTGFVSTQEDVRGMNLEFPFVPENPASTSSATAATPTVATGANKPETVPAASSNSARYCPDECKLRNAVWNGKDEYPYCNCVCKAGYEFDSSGLNCVPITSQSGVSGSPSGSGPETENALSLELETPEGKKPIKPGEYSQIGLEPGEKAALIAKCKEIQREIVVLRDAFESQVFGIDEFDAEVTPAGLLVEIVYEQKLEEQRNLNCNELLKNTMSKVFEGDFQGQLSSSPSIPLKLSLEQGMLEIEVLQDFAAVNVESPTATISSAGRNRFVVAYNPETHQTAIAALGSPISVQPAGGIQSPITLPSGQGIVVDSQGAGSVTPLNQNPNDENIPELSQPASEPATAGTGSGRGLNILDHTMSSQVDESTYQVLTRTSNFQPSDRRAYSWISFGNVGDAHQVEWRWFSPDGSLYSTYTQQIPKPSGTPWSWYNVYSYIPIAGYGAASMPGDWKVDIYLDGNKILTEQFSLVGLNGRGQVSGMTNGAIQGGCHTDPSTGRTICIDTISDFTNSENQPQGGCYTDPTTGQTICVDSIGSFYNPEGIVQGGCHTDPATGRTICIDTTSDFYNPETQPQGGCYTDPATGQTICVDTSSDFYNPGGEVQRGCFTDPDTGETICID